MAFLAALAPVLSAVGAGVSIATGIKSLVSSGGKGATKSTPPPPKPPPAPPSIADAEAQAEIDIRKRRRISALSGGNTNITRGKSLVPESAVGKKSLIGS